MDILTSCFGGSLFVAIGAIFVVIVFFMAVARVLGFLQKVAPNTALIVYGAGTRSNVTLLRRVKDPATGAINTQREETKVNFKIVKGGNVLVLPVIQDKKRLDLSLMTLDVLVKDVLSNDAVPLTVDGIAQIKIGSEDSLIATAAEQFLDQPLEAIRNSALQTLQGHLRAIIGQMKAADVYKDREGFSKQVIEVAVDDLAGMGFFIVSLTPKEIRDSVGYLESLGQPEIARAKKEAEIAKAQADREAAKEVQDAEQKKAEYIKQTNIARVAAEKARDIAEAEQNKRLEENRAAAAEIAAQRRAKELEAEVQRPADAERYRIEQLAQAALFKAQQDAEATKATGTAEGEATRAKGTAAADAEKARLLAEAEGRRQLVAALTGEGGPLAVRIILGQQLLGGIPQVAEAFAKAFTNVKEIRLVEIGGGGVPSGDGTTGAVQKFFDLLPTNMFKFLQGAAALLGTPIDDLFVAWVAQEAGKRGLKVTSETEKVIKEKVAEKLERATAEIPAQTPAAETSELPGASEEPSTEDVGGRSEKELSGRKRQRK